MRLSSADSCASLIVSPLERYRIQADDELLVLIKHGSGPHRMLGTDARRILDRTRTRAFSSYETAGAFALV